MCSAGEGKHGFCHAEQTPTRVPQRLVSFVSCPFFSRETSQTWRREGFGPLREEFAPFDAARRFPLPCPAGKEPPGCRCGQVIRGVEEPGQCPLFGRACTPEDPVGPCMVSGEGACAAAYRYRRQEGGLL